MREGKGEGEGKGERKGEGEGEGDLNSKGEEVRDYQKAN